METEGWKEKGWEQVKSVLPGGRAASSRAPQCPAWEQGCPRNSLSCSQVPLSPPQKQNHILVSLPQHTLGRKTTPKVSGDTLLLADVPKILLKGTFNEIKLLSHCFGFQGLFPRQKQLYGKLLVVKQSPTTHCDPVLENPLGIKIPFFSSYKPIMEH